MVHRQISIRWQISLGTSEAASLDAASVPEKETQWPNIMSIIDTLNRPLRDLRISLKRPNCFEIRKVVCLSQMH
jgi:hypothetical protein